MVIKEKNVKSLVRALFIVIVVLLGAWVTGIGVYVSINSTEEGYTSNIEFTSEQVPVELTEGIDNVEYGQGEVKVDGEEIPTVEAVDANGPQVNPEDETPAECPEGEECGRGSAYPYVDTSAPQAFIAREAP